MEGGPTDCNFQFTERKVLKNPFPFTIISTRCYLVELVFAICFRFLKILTQITKTFFHERWKSLQQLLKDSKQLCKVGKSRCIRVSESALKKFKYFGKRKKACFSNWSMDNRIWRGICGSFFLLLSFSRSQVVNFFKWKHHYLSENIFHPIPLFEQKKVSFDDNLKARGKKNHNFHS